MLTQFPTGLVSCVSDSYDIWNACDKVWGGELKDLVVQRGTTNSVLVVRPDSGDPPEVVIKVRFIGVVGGIVFVHVLGGMVFVTGSQIMFSRNIILTKGSI